jgi:hypothetical protein
MIWPFAVRWKRLASSSLMTMAVDPGCDCDRVHRQKRSRSNHRRRMIEAMTIRNRSPETQRRYLRVEVSARILIDALTLMDVTRCAISARETSVLSALGGA